MNDVIRPSETCNCGVGGPAGENHNPDCVRYVARPSKTKALCSCSHPIEAHAYFGKCGFCGCTLQAAVYPEPESRTVCCPDCNGLGGTNDTECTRCGGYGEIRAGLEAPEQCGGKCPRHGRYVLLGRKGPCPICEEIKHRDAAKPTAHETSELQRALHVIDEAGKLSDWINRARPVVTDLMAAYERRIRTDCTPKELTKEPWRCMEYIGAEGLLRDQPIAVVELTAQKAKV